MTKENYMMCIEAINIKSRAEKNRIYRKYAESHNPHEIGDIIKDSCGSILIESMDITFGFGYEYPSMKYHGIELRKDLKPRKDGNRRTIWQDMVLIEKMRNKL